MPHFEVRGLKIYYELHGQDLAEHVSTARPGTPVLLLSGYMPEEITTRGARQDYELLTKPFTAAELLARVSTLLDDS